MSKTTEFKVTSFAIGNDRVIAETESGEVALIASSEQLEKLKELISMFEFKDGALYAYIAE